MPYDELKTNETDSSSKQRIEENVVDTSLVENQESLDWAKQEKNESRSSSPFEAIFLARQC